MQINEGQRLNADELFSRLPHQLRNHSLRVGSCMHAMAEHAPELLSWYGFDSMDSLLIAAYDGGIYHEIGKLLMPMSEDQLAEQEDLHPIYGRWLLANCKNRFFDNQAYRWMVLDTVRFHRILPSGREANHGVQTDKIPMAAILCAVADTFDTLVMRQRASINDAMAYVRNNDSGLFSQKAVVCFEKSVFSLLKLYSQWEIAM